jgi:hypothetical protein
MINKINRQKCITQRATSEEQSPSSEAEVFSTPQEALFVSGNKHFAAVVTITRGDL